MNPKTCTKSIFRDINCHKKLINPSIFEEKKHCFVFFFLTKNSQHTFLVQKIHDILNKFYDCEKYFKSSWIFCISNRFCYISLYHFYPGPRHPHPFPPFLKSATGSMRKHRYNRHNNRTKKTLRLKYLLSKRLYRW